MSGYMTPIAVALAGTFGFSVSWTATDIATYAPRSLNLELLEYNDDGTVSQRLSGGVPAEWSARIDRKIGNLSIPLCEGKSDTPGLYVGEKSTWSVDDWIGGDCPELIDGDRARAAWEYRNDQGLLVTVIGEFIVGQDKAK